MAHDHDHLAEILDLDVEVLSKHHQEMMTWATADIPAHAYVVDLGAGTGTGTLALASQLPQAQLVALDIDADMLARIAHKAHVLGLADRIQTVQADLDKPWPDQLKPADLVWAANSLHHMGDPEYAAAQIFAALRPGGVLAVTEMDSFPRFLTDPAGAALEERVHVALAAGRAEAGLHMRVDWPACLARAGLEVEAEHRFDVVLDPPLSPAAIRYAGLVLHRASRSLDGKLAGDDLTELGAIAAGIGGRDDLAVRASRTAWRARRPA